MCVQRVVDATVKPGDSFPGRCGNQTGLADLPGTHSQHPWCSPSAKSQKELRQFRSGMNVHAFRV